MTICAVCRQEFPLLDVNDQPCNKCQARKPAMSASEVKVLNVLFFLFISTTTSRLLGVFAIESAPMCHLWHYDKSALGNDLPGLY